MELVARFVREHRAFNQPNGSRFIIGRAAVEAGSDQQIPDFVKPHDITVIGDAQPGKLVPGLTYTWESSTTTPDTARSSSFAASRCRSRMAATA